MVSHPLFSTEYCASEYPVSRLLTTFVKSVVRKATTSGVLVGHRPYVSLNVVQTKYIVSRLGEVSVMKEDVLGDVCVEQPDPSATSPMMIAVAVFIVLVSPTLN